MLPFDNYPGGGAVLLGKKSGGNCRKGYGFTLQKITKQHICAYCGIDLTSNFYRWLLTSVDHVVPVKECERLRIPTDFAQDYSNMVLCCLGCNAFNNRYRVKDYDHKTKWTLSEFFLLRDEVFLKRKGEIKQSREKDEGFFNEKIEGNSFD